ncbi:hypothetical protein Sta7437_1149 [Stanieria cyanosphaera PCC 7437]|uniref:Uncharacterized protein n=1 Tax=Stanieria cyanosphaera (strain ATCC 29371 / PCC 7437) TaxID=111780 RepID=K9XQ22_STAC7|nr:hypothetical protein [Stanieria cyanosphaera]AFZ34720.1 hypothetical protein Sta7437_1149 [Stanieria cyanosphaera PCC 7437]
MINTQLSWLIPLVGSIYLLSIHLMLWLGQNIDFKQIFPELLEKLTRD